MMSLNYFLKSRFWSDFYSHVNKAKIIVEKTSEERQKANEKIDNIYAKINNGKDCWMLESKKHDCSMLDDEKKDN